MEMGFESWKNAIQLKLISHSVPDPFSLLNIETEVQPIVGNTQFVL